MWLYLTRSVLACEDDYCLKYYVIGHAYAMRQSVAQQLLARHDATRIDATHPHQENNMTRSQRLLVRTIAPSTEPLTLAEAKLYLRVDDNAEDRLITEQITVSRELAEQFLRRSLMPQTWKLAYDDGVPAEVALPRGPVQSVVSVLIRSASGIVQTVAASTYTLTAAKQSLRFSQSLTGDQIEITYVTGYATQAEIPRAIRQGMLAQLSALYDNRGEAVDGISPQAAALWAPYREVLL